MTPHAPRLRCAIALLAAATGCASGPGRRPVSESALHLRGQPVPATALAPSPADFEVPAGVAVLHYYGAGGWGIQWRGTYVLAAPYFSNHDLMALLASPLAKLVPKEAEVRAGLAGTPVGRTNVLLIGHGHVDHTGDVPALFSTGLIASRPALIADRSTTNQLAALAPHFGCIAPVDYDDPDAAAARCPVPGVRITPIHHAHAPHLNVAGLDVAAYGGSVKAPRADEPSRADDYKLGNTWAYLVDLLDERGAVVFRIHYVDAAASPPHGLVPAKLLAERDVDVHIACVPGFEQSEDYPDAVLEHHRARYVLLGHWEDFFQPRGAPLRPLRQVLDEPALERFVDVVERKVVAGRGGGPLNKTAERCTAAHPCGPHAETWALPVPGETYQFDTGAR